MNRQDWTRCPECCGRLPYCAACNHTGFKVKPQQPDSLSADELWLQKMAALEDGCIVSVGGLVTDLEAGK